MKLRTVLLLNCLVVFAVCAQAQRIEDYKGNPLYRSSNYMSGNLVRTVFYNYGLVGNLDEISGEWPIGTGNEYVGDVSPLVAIQFVHPSGDTLVSVTTSDGPRGFPDGPPGGGAFWGFEPLMGFAAAAVADEDPRVAVSNQPSTWPTFWPDRELDDVRDQSWWRDENDPGWRGSWNGYFGKNVMSADQETYFQMDDHADGEWFQRISATGDTLYYYPSREDSTRRGLGLRVAVRGLQWSHFLAQDVIFWLYEITNISSYAYNKVAFGMMVGTLSGGREDSRDDRAYFDLENDITYSWDSDDEGSPGWVPVRPGEINVGYVGYAFLESPGNPYDGIDNDGDSRDRGGANPFLESSTLFPMLAPQILEEGQTLILIDYETYERFDTVLTAEGILYNANGREITIRPGDEVYEDGRNNIDDNYNGLIDERQDHLDLGYIDYFSGFGLEDTLIDEARDDGIDNDNDWNPFTDDVGADGVATTGDYGEGDGYPTNGEPNFDRTDVDESDQIGLSAFEYFTPPSAIIMRDDPTLWARMAPGHFDVVSEDPEDGDFIYGSGYFPLQPGQTERFSMALAYGEDLADITENKITVQQIYDENYNFARPPEKPTIWVVPGDGRVTLYWDDIAESSFDPVTGEDFEGYKIYRATDPGFNEIFTITDGRGRRVFHRSIAQFDLDNGNAGFFPVIRNSIIYYLGEDTGLEHSWVDSTVENGQRYYYAVVAYDHGDVEKEILPAENSKTIVVDESGDVTLDRNTVVVTPRAPAAGYEGPEVATMTHVSGNGTGAIGIEMLDPDSIEDNQPYEFSFQKTVDTTAAFGLGYRINRIESDGSRILLAKYPLIVEDKLLPLAAGFASYYDSLFNLYPGTYDPARYFRVARSIIYQGQQAYILIPRGLSLIPEVSGWADTTRNLYSYNFVVTHYAPIYLDGVPFPSDYQIEWYEDIVDVSTYFNHYDLLILPPTPVHFRVKNLNRDEYIPFAFDEVTETENGLVDHAEVLIFLEPVVVDTVEPVEYDTLVTWSVEFRSIPSRNDTVRPGAGDILSLLLYQSHTVEDTFRYTTRAERINSSAVNLDRIKVYPNPYVAVSNQEPTNPFNEGRGERRITFIHLPDRCTIRIYTVRGELVDTIEHNAGIDDGSENWDLRSRDGLNVAYGIYLYHIDSPYGQKTGRFALIK